MFTINIPDDNLNVASVKVDQIKAECAGPVRLAEKEDGTGANTKNFKITPPKKQTWQRILHKFLSLF